MLNDDEIDGTAIHTAPAVLLNSLSKMLKQRRRDADIQEVERGDEELVVGGRLAF
jgi:hypothetical protein